MLCAALSLDVHPPLQELTSIFAVAQAALEQHAHASSDVQAGSGRPTGVRLHGWPVWLDAEAGSKRQAVLVLAQDLTKLLSMSVLQRTGQTLASFVGCAVQQCKLGK